MNKEKYVVIVTFKNADKTDNDTYEAVFSSWGEFRKFKKIHTLSGYLARTILLNKPYIAICGCDLGGGEF